MNPHPTWRWCGLLVSRVDTCLEPQREHPYPFRPGGCSQLGHRVRWQWYVRLFGRWIKYWEQRG